MDQVLQETKNIRPMTNQVAYNTFIAHGRDQCALPTGPKVILIYIVNGLKQSGVSLVRTLV